MTLQPGFRFSQASLQDYADCPRRFELRYIERLAWPALGSEPALEHERQLRLGQRFHQLMHQVHLGIPREKLEASIEDAVLLDWWRAFLAHPVEGLPPVRRPEFALSAPLGGFRLMAKFDLLAVKPGERAVIVDWKTGSKPPRRTWLEARLQTRVYPFVLAEAGAQVYDGELIAPRQISLVYWFTSRPAATEVFAYSQAQHDSARGELEALIAEASSRQSGEYPLTGDEARCRFCAFRSLCGRGVQAGGVDDLEDFDSQGDDDDSLDLDQVAEIEF